MASRAHTRNLSQHLHSLMEENQLKLEYVAASADIGIETVRRVKKGDVTKLWDRTARRLADFIQRESGGLIQLTDLESTINQPESDLFRHLVESNMDGIYLIQDKRIIYSNSRVEAMTGYSSDELSAVVYTRFLDGESRKREQDRKTSKSRGLALSDRYEVGVLTKEGKRLRAETHIARLSLDGKKTALGTLRELGD